MSRSVTLIGYAVIASGMVVVHVAGLVGTRLLTLGAVLRLLTSRRAGRWMVVAAWLWLGWHLFVRAAHG